MFPVRESPGTVASGTIGAAARLARARLVIVLALLPPLLACDGDRSGSDRNVYASARWTLEEDLRLGVLEGGGPEQFGQIAGIQTDEAGRIYILDFPAQEIRVFEPDGSFSHVIGRKGEGPGELLGAAGMNFGPGGLLWVWDPSANRYSAFRKDGTFVESHERLVRGVIFPWRGGFGPDGHYWDWGLDRPDDVPGRRIGARVILHPIRVSRDFRSLDTFPPLEYEHEMASDGRGPLPYGGGLVAHLDRSGAIWFARTREYRIFRRTLEGEITDTLRRSFEPAPVTPRERDSIRSDLVGAPEMLRVPIEEIPDTKPVVRGIFGDGRGHIYVIPELADHPVGTVVDIFEEDGDYLGRVPFPERIRHAYPRPHATEDHLYVVVTDEFDVQYVSRLKILRSQGIDGG